MYITVEQRNASPNYILSLQYTLQKIVECCIEDFCRIKAIDGMMELSKQTPDIVSPIWL